MFPDLFFALIYERRHHIIHEFSRIVFGFGLVVVRNWTGDFWDPHKLAKWSPALFDVVDEESLVGFGFDIGIVGFVSCSELIDGDDSTQTLTPFFVDFRGTYIMMFITDGLSKSACWTYIFSVP